jgi:hypothetical protein
LNADAESRRPLVSSWPRALNVPTSGSAVAEASRRAGLVAVVVAAVSRNKLLSIGQHLLDRFVHACAWLVETGKPLIISAA